MRVIRLPRNKVWRVVNHSSSLCYSTLAVKYMGLSNQFFRTFCMGGGLTCFKNTKETFQLTMGNSESHASLFWPLTLTVRLVTQVNASNCSPMFPFGLQQKHGWFKRDAATKLWHEATARKKGKSQDEHVEQAPRWAVKRSTVITAWTFTQSSKIDVLNRCSDSMN